jgi:EAL domain-containing protein (putative c-di-GMP-specific phosphodiesterase class I)
MDREQLFNFIRASASTYRLATVAILLLLIALVTALVYATGGIKYVYSHAMYVPIILSGMVFGLRGGVLAGLIAGLALGPLMPINTATGEMQLVINWVYRAFFFTLVGTIAGAAFHLFTEHILFLQWLRLHDPRSKLPNYWSLIDQLQEWSGKPGSGNHVLALFDFKSMDDISSILGVQSSDELIVDINEQLRSYLPLEASIYHSHAQKLVALIPVAAQGNTPGLINRLSSKLTDNPLNYRGIPIYTDPYIGYLNLDDEHDEPAHILRKAEIAANWAKTRAIPSLNFSREFDSHTRENLELLGELGEAIKQHQLELHHQPKIVLADNSVHSVETLIRWNHPTRGYIPPGQFIPRAEGSLLINHLTDYVIDTTLRQLRTWHEEGKRLPIAVNISTRNLMQKNFASGLLAKLDHYRLDGALLEIEITESALMLDIDESIAKLRQLADAGISITIDDFGTGYSSLQYLSRLPISYLKIDQSFVFNMLGDEHAREIVASIINLAHTLGMKVVAEGVEDEASVDLLRDMGCDIGQGYHFAKPLHPDKFDAWYRHHLSTMPAPYQGGPGATVQDTENGTA